MTSHRLPCTSSLLAPLIPWAATGRPRVSDRQVINGMVYKIRAGIPWRDLPERYGQWKTVHTRGGRGRQHRLAGPDRLHCTL
ncbi:transposase [Streptomyces sp. NPDC020571]|uniref:transposase n=1 Tax=unclassified Streptomyces TaxID=2593676 RepID=UPI00379855C4